MARTNFVVFYEGSERLLFALRTSQSGVVYLSKPDLTTFGSEDLSEVKDLHLTVHFQRNFESEGILGHKIKTTMLSTNNEMYEKSVIVKVGGKSKLVWPVNTAIIGDMKTQQFDFKPKCDDENIELLGNMGISNNIVYTIFAHDSAISMPNIQGFSIYTKNYGNISITLYLGFVTFPNTQMSIATFNIRGALAINGKLAEAQSPIMTPMHTREIEIYLQMITMSVTRAAASRLIEEIHKISSPPISMESIIQDLQAIDSKRFSRWPKNIDVKHYDYGIMARTKNDIYSSKFTLDGIIKPDGFDAPSKMSIYE